MIRVLHCVSTFEKKKHKQQNSCIKGKDLRYPIPVLVSNCLQYKDWIIQADKNTDCFWIGNAFMTCEVEFRSRNHGRNNKRLKIIYENYYLKQKEFLESPFHCPSGLLVCYTNQVVPVSWFLSFSFAWRHLWKFKITITILK